VILDSHIPVSGVSGRSQTDAPVSQAGAPRTELPQKSPSWSWSTGAAKNNIVKLSQSPFDMPEECKALTSTCAWAPRLLHYLLYLAQKRLDDKMKRQGMAQPVLS
jgi:hypothetical protein